MATETRWANEQLTALPHRQSAVITATLIRISSIFIFAGRPRGIQPVVAYATNFPSNWRDKGPAASLVSTVLVFTMDGTEVCELMSELLVYVGTYTMRGSEGIYAYRFDTETGTLRRSGLAATVNNPTFLAVDQQRSCVYSVEETAAVKIGAVHSYRADLSTGSLTALNEVPSLGTGPCYLAFDKTGRYLLTANYHSGSITIFPRLEDGRLGQASAFVQHQGSSQDPIRQQGSARARRCHIAR